MRKKERGREKEELPGSFVNLLEEYLQAIFGTPPPCTIFFLRLAYSVRYTGYKLTATPQTDWSLEC